LIYVYFLHKSNQKTFLHSLLLELEKGAEVSDSYKEVILEAMQMEKRRNSILFKDYIATEFSQYMGEDCLVKDRRTKEKLQTMVKQDRTISKKIHNFGKIYIYKIQQFEGNEELKRHFFERVKIPQYLPHNPDYNFYSKSLDFKNPHILGKSTLGLKRNIFRLNKHLEVLTFQIGTLNELIVEEKNLLIIYQYYCQVCMNLLDLDRYIKSTYGELRKFLGKPRQDEVKNLIHILERELD